MSHHPWTHSYPEYIRWETHLHATSVEHLLEDAAARWPEHIALEFMGRKISYAELDRLANRAAAGMQRLGVRPGVHVGLYLGNVPQYVIAFFGVLKAGGTVVNYSPLDAQHVLEHKIEDSKTDILITLDAASLYPQVRPMLGSTRLKNLVVASLAEFSAAPSQLNAQLVKAGQLSDVQFDEGCIPFTRLLDNDGRYQVHAIDDPAQALAVLQYTGGTTGLPKGAMLSHANLGAATAQVYATNVDNDKLLHDGQEIVLVALPLFHIYALITGMLFGIRMGATLVLALKFEPGAALRDISERKITVFPGVPTMFTALIGQPGVEQFDLRSLKVCASGGAPLAVELLHRFRQMTGCTLAEGWGMTETASIGTFTPTMGRHKAGACGIPQPGTLVKFIDVENPTRTVSLGERGEIAISGPNVMQGYWNNSDATRESFTADGFFRTGDVGYMDEDGFVFIVDRTKDMLLCSGYNVYPRVIEEAIYAHPAVEEVMVIGIPDEYRGQAPKAYMKLRPDHAPFTLNELKDFLRDKIGKHEMVQALEFRKELPKTAVGKLSKKDLREEMTKPA